MKKITGLEYNTIMWFLIRATFIEITSEILLKINDNDAWISILISVFLGIIPFSIYTYIKNKYPNDTIFSLNKKTKIGTIINLIMISGIFIFAVCSFWIIVNFVDSQYLYKTDTLLIIIILIIPVIYAAIKDVRIFGKVSLIMFYISIIFISIILLGLIPNIKIDNLKPFLENQNILTGSFYLIGFNILPIFLLTIIPKNKIENYSIKKSFIFYLISALSLLNVMFLTISIFGIQLSQLYNYPSFHLLKRVSVLDTIDRVESILSLEWFLALFTQIVMSVYFVKEGIKETFNQKKTNNIIPIITCLLIAILTYFIFPTKGTEMAYFQNILIYILYIICLIFPIITFFKSLKKT